MIRSILKADFIKWLNSKKSDEVVGLAINSRHSIFVNYVLETQDITSVYEFSTLGFYLSSDFNYVFINNLDENLIGNYYTMGRIRINNWGKDIIRYQNRNMNVDDFMTARKVLEIMNERNN